MSPSAGLDVYPPRHPISFIFPSLRVTPRVPTALHLPVTHIDDITRPIAIYNDTYKFIACPYSILSKFAVDNKVTVTSHPKVMRMLHTWHTDFDRILKRSASIAHELHTPCDSGISFVFSRDDVPRFIICAFIELLFFTVNLSGRASLHPPPWSRREILALLPRLLPWPD